MAYGIGDALLDGLMGGLSQYGSQVQQQKDIQRQRQQKDEEARYARVAAEQMAKFKASLEPPRYQTIKDTIDGQLAERTIRSAYDPTSGGYAETEVGRAEIPREPKAPTVRTFTEGGVQIDKQFNPQTGGWDAIGAPSPRWRPGGGGDGESGGRNGDVSFDVYQSWDPERRAAYDRFRGRAERKDFDREDEKFVSAEISRAMRDFNDENKRPAMLASFGIELSRKDQKDPKKLEAARQRIRQRVRDELKSDRGLPLFEGVQSKTESTAQAAGEAGKSQSNPVVVASKEQVASLPPGTWVRLPNGVVRQK